MADDLKWDSKFFFDFLWKVLELALIEQAERKALVEALTLSGALPREPYETLRREKVEATQETIRAAAQGDDNPLLELLRAYKGTVQ